MQTATPSKASLDQNSEALPANFWQLTVNDPSTISNITVPGAGTLVVTFAPAQPVKAIYVAHQGGSTTPINVGVNTIPVGAQDTIVIQLFNPATDSFKLGYQME